MNIGTLRHSIGIEPKTEDCIPKWFKLKLVLNHYQLNSFQGTTYRCSSVLLAFKKKKKGNVDVQIMV